MQQPLSPLNPRARPFKPSVAQPKNALSAPGFKRPTAPPVYRPQPAPRVLQTKKPATPPVPEHSRRVPVAPPAYRPQTVPKVLQAKKPVGLQPPAAQSPRQPVAPAAYRPETKKTVQLKRAASSPTQMKPTGNKSFPAPSQQKAFGSGGHKVAGPPAPGVMPARTQQANRLFQTQGQPKTGTLQRTASNSPRLGARGGVIQRVNKVHSDNDSPTVINGLNAVLNQQQAEVLINKVGATSLIQLDLQLVTRLVQRLPAIDNTWLNRLADALLQLSANEIGTLDTVAANNTKIKFGGLMMLTPVQIQTAVQRGAADQQGRDAVALTFKIANYQVSAVTETNNRLEVTIEATFADGRRDDIKLNVSHQKHVLESYRDTGYSPPVSGVNTNTISTLSLVNFKDAFQGYADFVAQQIMGLGAIQDYKPNHANNEHAARQNLSFHSDNAAFGRNIHCFPTHTAGNAVVLTDDQLRAFRTVTRLIYTSAAGVTPSMFAQAQTAWGNHIAASNAIRTLVMPNTRWGNVQLQVAYQNALDEYNELALFSTSMSLFTRLTT